MYRSLPPRYWDYVHVNVHDGSVCQVRTCLVYCCVIYSSRVVQSVSSLLSCLVNNFPSPSTPPPPLDPPVLSFLLFFSPPPKVHRTIQQVEGGVRLEIPNVVIAEDPAVEAKNFVVVGQLETAMEGMGKHHLSYH